MSLEDLYLTTTVPLPSRALEIGETDTPEEACVKIDGFFEDLIRAYTPQTQALLRDMYYREKNIVRGDDPLQPPRTRARIAEDDTLAQEIEISRVLLESPLFGRYCKIIQVVFAVGQMQDRLDRAGLGPLLEDTSSGALRAFVTQSIAPTEKLLADGLPKPLVDAALALIHPQETREKMRVTVAERRESSYDDNIMLRHYRSDASLPPELHGLLHGRPDVKMFDTWMRGDRTGPVPTAVRRIYSMPVDKLVN